MPYTVVYTEILRVENLNIWRDENGDIKVNINLRIATADGQTDKYSKIFSLAPAEKTAIINFVKARVQEVGIELDVEIPEWAKEA